MSAQDVADQLADLGHPISRASLSLIETGQRGVSLADVLAIASVLGEVPLALVTGLDATVEALPGRQVGSVTFADWAMGNGLLGLDQSASPEPPAFTVWRDRLALDKQLRELAAAHALLESLLLREPIDSPERVEQQAWVMALQDASVAAHETLMKVLMLHKACRDAGLAVEKLPEWLEDVPKWVEFARRRFREWLHRGSGYGRASAEEVDDAP